MAGSDSFVIVGASLAGAKAAATLRAEGFDGSITLIGSEQHHPYERPPLSKDFLQGKADRDSVFVENADWYDEHDVDLRMGTTAVGLELSTRTVSLDSGERLRYDALLLATGSSPNALDAPGHDLDGVHYLRTIENSESLASVLKGEGKRVVVIGSGWIGMEVAASATVLGNEVVVLDRGEVPLSAALGSELGRVFADLHRDNGVDIRSSVSVERIVGEGGRATGVVIDGGEVVPADIVIVGIGVHANLELAQLAGLETSDRGLLVDAALCASDPHVFGAGDIVDAVHPVIGQRLHVEHWQNAISTGEAAARSMVGQSVSFADIPYFFTDQFDLGMELSGYPPLMTDAALVFRGDVAGREFVVFWQTSEGRVVGGMNVNVWDVNEQVQRLIRRGTPVDAAALADIDTPLDTL
jgi:NADPH-dependent 2,4-dienoyl-CoA reductase/sulfur reductase-like enzyme